MRSLLALVVPALLSLSLVACASDDANEETHEVVVNPLVKEGEKCTQDSDCTSNRCLIAESNLGIKGMPAPCMGKECGVPGDDDDDSTSTKGKPAPGPTPGGQIDPSPAPAPAPQPTPGGVGVCAG